MTARRCVRRGLPFRTAICAGLVLSSGSACRSDPSAGAPSAMASLAPSAPTAPPSSPRPIVLTQNRLETALAEGPITSVTLSPGTKGLAFSATLEGPEGQLPSELRIAPLRAPRAYRSDLAFHHLARALNLDVVPELAYRSVGVGALAALVTSADVRRALEQAAIQNDGTADALVSLPLPAGLRAVGELTTERALWSSWAASATPLPGEDAKLLQAFISTQVLDYLGGNVARPAILYDERARSLVLADNAGAFPLHLEAHALDHLLAKLRTFQRFPRSLFDALKRLDHARVLAAFSPGAFETWLLPPRTLVELEERRAGVLTLVEARIAERGDADVLSL